MTASKDQTCPPDLDQLAEAWVALWQAELAAMAADPEVVAAWRDAFGLGAAWLRAARSAAPPPDEPAAPAPGTAASGAASGLFRRDPLGGADDAALLARIELLERRIAALEGRAAGGSAPRRGARRQRTPA